jgi:V/A-type H+-transporting ATPase subunit K
MISPLLDLRFVVAPAVGESVPPAAEMAGRWFEYGLLGVAVAAIMICAAFATAMAQRSIGPAAIGAAAEDKGFRGTAILLVALPETILIVCAGIAYMLLQKVQ